MSDTRAVPPASRTPYPSPLRADGLIRRLRGKVDRDGWSSTAVRGLQLVRERWRGSPQQLGLVTLEITTYCNLLCAGCPRTIQDNKGNWSNGHMSFDTFRRIIDSLPSVRVLNTQGIGEPTMNPQLPEMISYAKRAGKFDEITFNSNLHTHSVGYYEDLFARGLSTLSVSVDSLEQGLADRLRAGTSVALLKERISTLASRFPGRIATRTVLGAYNAAATPRLLADLNDLGRLSAEFQPYDDQGDPGGCQTLQERATFARDLPPMAAQFKNLTVHAVGFVPNPEVCPAPWTSPGIAVDGSVVPCCRTLETKPYVFGRADAESFENLWHSAGSETMRRAFAETSPAYCEGCPSYCMRHT